MNRFALPPIIQPTEEGYEAQREQAQAAKIFASMELKLHGQVSGELRHVMDARPVRAVSNYDPHRW